jgi:hypothetical protein
MRGEKMSNKSIVDYIVGREQRAEELLKDSNRCRNEALHLESILEYPIEVNESGKLFTRDLSLVNKYLFFTDFDTSRFQNGYEVSVDKVAEDIRDKKITSGRRDYGFSIWPVFYFDIKSGNNSFSGKGLGSVGNVIDYKTHWTGTGKEGMYESTVYKREVLHKKDMSEIASILFEGKMSCEMVAKYKQDVENIRKIFPKGEYDYDGKSKLKGGDK